MEKWVKERDQHINELDDQLRSSRDKAHELELKIIGRDQRINELNDLLKRSNDWAHELKSTIADMQRSVLWQLLMKYQIGFVERALPHGTVRREKHDLAIKGARILFNEGWSSFYKNFINFRSTQHRFNSEPAENEAPSSQERIEQSEEEVLVHHQEVPLEIIPIEAHIELKKGYNRIRFHIPEGCERPCDIPEMKSGDGKYLNMGVKDISIMDGIGKLPMNWHETEGSNGTLRWLSNDATMVVDSIADCNAKLVLKACSLYRPRALEIYTKRCNFKKYEGKKFMLLKGVEIKADKNAVKNELDNILERLNNKI
ncbi:MAG: hypothetical protein ACYDHX_02425 [Methanothrix sp.]